MAKRVAVYWPGDARAKPNELAIPSIEAATVQMEREPKIISTILVRATAQGYDRT